MRSNMITVATVVTSALLMTHAAFADPVQEQLKLMEQRMAEMEDRLQATSDELQSAQATVSQQQGLLTDAGLVEEDKGLRSAVGQFADLVDVSGVVAGSFNYRIIDSDINGDLAGGNDLFRHPNANTFALDQAWFTIDKPATEESRGGMHVELVYGQSSFAQGGEGTSVDTGPGGSVDVDFSDDFLLYSAYASYLAPIGNGVEISLGRLATPLGAELVQTNQNYFVTQGRVFGLQPVTHTGVSASTAINDNIGVIVGVVNEVYSDTFVSTSNDKAYYGQVQFSGENFGLNVGGIYGSDTAGSSCSDGSGGGRDCTTSVVDVVLTADPTENLSLWVNYDWAHSGGHDYDGHGDQHGLAVAGRLGVTDTMGIASRFEYVFTEDSLVGSSPGTEDEEIISLTTTLDKRLTDNLVSRIELRWDHDIDDDQSDVFADDNENQLVAFWEMFYEF